MSERKSEAAEPELITDPKEKAEREAANALRQTEWGLAEVEKWIKAGQPRLASSLLLKLHRHALEGLSQYAGLWRPDAVGIKGSSHQPIPGREVPEYVEEMLEYLESNWDRKSPNHLAAYAMWRLNWIHPFSDGNGRTSRIFSYMILIAKIGHLMPGSNTIPNQISENKVPYYRALESADEAFKQGSINLSDLENLLGGLLANQLVDVLGIAQGEKFVIDVADNPSPTVVAPVQRDTFQKAKGWIENNQGKTGLAVGLFGVIVTIIIAIL